jgi:hypothetical protein
MTRLRRRFARDLPVFAALMFGACTPPPPPTPQGRADQQAQAACRQRADQVYAEQNRGAAYEADNRLSPFSSSYVPGVTTRGLGDRYSRDTMIADCVRNASRQPADRSAGPAMEPVGTSGPGMAPAGR